MVSAVMITPRIGQVSGRNQFQGVSQSLSKRPNSVMAISMMNMGATPMDQTMAIVERALPMVINVLPRQPGALQVICHGERALAQEPDALIVHLAGELVDQGIH